MKFDYKKFLDHSWCIICDDDGTFQVFCNKCMYRVSFLASYTIESTNIIVENPTGFIVANNGTYNQQYSDRNIFLPPINYMNIFFEMNSCDELIVKNIIE